MLSCSKLTAILFLLFTFLSVKAQDENPWELRKDQEGIKVFVRDKPGSRLKEIKVYTTYEASLSSLIYTLKNKKGFKDWVYSSGETYYLKELGNKESYHYQVTKAPWPVEDRDLVLHTVIKQDPVTKTITMEAKGVPDYIPVKGDKVRVRDYEAFWSIKPLGKNKIEINYFISLDPGGNIPAWVINLAVAEAPYQTMYSLKKELEKNKNVKLKYIEELE